MKIVITSGHKIVSPEKWIDLMTQRLEVMKSEIKAKGALLLCIEVENDLSAQGLATGIDGPSFRCSSASIPTEHAICSNRGLWSKDRAIASIYSFIRKYDPGPNAKSPQTLQREWLAARNACGADASCINHIYDQRLQQLREVDLPS